MKITHFGFAGVLLLFMTGCAGQGGPTVASSPPANVQAPAADVPPQFAAFSGRWNGIWDSNPAWTSSLTVESVSPKGEVSGSYVYMSTAPVRFRTTIVDNSIKFGSSSKFTFVLKPNGTVDALREFGGGMINTSTFTKG